MNRRGFLRGALAAIAGPVLGRVPLLGGPTAKVVARTVGPIMLTLVSADGTRWSIPASGGELRYKVDRG